MSYPNEGARQLAVALETQGINKNKCDQMLNCSTATTHRLLNGERLPGRIVSLLLQEHFGIPLDAWDRPAVEDDPAESGPGDSRRPTEGAA